MKLLDNSFVQYKTVRSDSKNKARIEVQELKELFHTSDEDKRHEVKPEYNTFATCNAYIKLLVQIAPNGGIAFGFKRGRFNDYQVITYLCDFENNQWYLKFFATSGDVDWVSEFRKLIDQQPSDKKVLSKDLFNIYSHINTDNSYLIYNPESEMPYREQTYIIDNNLDKLELSEQVLSGIVHMSNHYPSKYCMDLWLEWLYFAMTAEYFHTKHGYSVTGKLVKELAIVQCLYSNLKAPEISLFSRSKDYKTHKATKAKKYSELLGYRHFGRYLCDLAEEYHTLWETNLTTKNNLELGDNKDLIYNPGCLQSFLAMNINGAL